jgi:hypothetical protein
MVVKIEAADLKPAQNAGEFLTSVWGLASRYQPERFQN